jgi:enoyl-[acyl-carrier protein] reductase II
MLKTRITEQYGLKVPFINAGMAFVATTPLVRRYARRGHGNAGRYGYASRRAASGAPRHQSSRPRMFGVNFIARFSVIEHIEVNAALGEVLRWL